MPYYCTVPRCTSMAGKAKNVSFHQFPRDEELANIWNVILKRGKPYTKYSKVCSLHFTPDDYTLNSVGKNKGQWRTLRKDAIPSQNLPSESPSHPPPRARGWLKDGEGSVDTQMHQQLAQAVYLQTMLAMQGSNCAQPHDSTSNTQTDRKQDHITSYKCEECSKCFKDPDVFVLHQRSHGKSQKENILINADLVKADTLSANPILANLLKSSAQGLPNVNILDPNSLLNVENQIMSALVANMENYVRNLSSLMANQSEKSEGGETVEDDDSDNDDNMVIDENYHSSFKDDDDDNKNSDIDCLKENSSVITQSECKIESEHINDIENGPSDNVKIENHISQLCNDDMSNNDYNTEDDQADSDKYDRKSDLKSLCNDHCLENDHSSNNEKHHQSDNNQTLSKNDDFISVNDIKSETSNDHDFENDHTSEINQTHINENDDLSSANDLNSRYSSNNHDFENFHTSHNISENLVYKGVQTPNCDRKDFNIEDTKQIV